MGPGWPPKPPRSDFGVALGPFGETQNPTFSHFGVIFEELFFGSGFGCFLGWFLDGFWSVLGDVLYDI